MLSQFGSVPPVAGPTAAGPATGVPSADAQPQGALYIISKLAMRDTTASSSGPTPSSVSPTCRNAHRRQRARRHRERSAQAKRLGGVLARRPPGHVTRLVVLAQQLRVRHGLQVRGEPAGRGHVQQAPLHSRRELLQRGVVRVEGCHQQRGGVLPDAEAPQRLRQRRPATRADERTAPTGGNNSSSSNNSNNDDDSGRCHRSRRPASRTRGREETINVAADGSGEGGGIVGPVASSLVGAPRRCAWSRRARRPPPSAGPW
eukprot:scaffold2973_cov325-Prasinococcus_capsulatus_cf.AAC.7